MARERYLFFSQKKTYHQHYWIYDEVQKFQLSEEQKNMRSPYQKACNLFWQKIYQIILQI
jgi:hypothetical protein